ncbi:conserved hypothetical protein [Coccidioides posadasii str. Silveira]|uniref:Uncharacterized protein n=1 Tax=Coccidioides posadasii (strain RMSCC 757 / Silveira) TaxID=443226 RepID=E9DJV0_COCPS|nr:conserved hypothetical protein [Coccidioides posadasii str. Silveira]
MEKEKWFSPAGLSKTSLPDTIECYFAFKQASKSERLSSTSERCSQRSSAVGTQAASPGHESHHNLHRDAHLRLRQHFMGSMRWQKNYEIESILLKNIKNLNAVEGNSTGFGRVCQVAARQSEIVHPSQQIDCRSPESAHLPSQAVHGWS